MSEFNWYVSNGKGGYSHKSIIIIARLLIQNTAYGRNFLLVTKNGTIYKANQFDKQL